MENNKDDVQHFLQWVEDTGSLNAQIYGEDIFALEQELDKINIPNYKKPQDFGNLLDKGITSYTPPTPIISINPKIQTSLTQAARKGGDINEAIKKKMRDDRQNKK